MPLPPQLVGKAVSIEKQPNQRRGGGRKPKLVKKWIKESNLDKRDAQKILIYLLSNFTAEKLSEMAKTEFSEVSAMTYIFIVNVVDAIKRKDFGVMRQIMDFCFGGETAVKVEGNAQFVDLKTLIIDKAGESPGERERIIADLERLTGYEERG